MITMRRQALLAELIERLDAAASLHVYGADLRERHTGVRRCYRLPVR